MESLQKIINLIKKTGDKAVILDKNGDLSCVVMTVADYEKLVLGQSGIQGLTEEELLDKINRDIEIWKDSKEIDHLPIDQYDFSQELDKKDDSWLVDDSSDLSNQLDNGLDNDDFSLNLDNSQGVIDGGILDDEDEDEDRYYFEPVE